VAEGVLAPTAAARYLGIEDPDHYKAAHRKAVDEARTAARRHGDPAWRLLGIEVDPGRGEALARAARQPPLNEWAAEEGIEDWSEREQLTLYLQRFGSAGETGQDTGDATRAARLQTRTARLRERRLALLRELEHVAASPARVDEKLAGWFDDVTTERLSAAGASTLGDVQLWISQGSRWWAGVPALGDAKARAIAATVTRLIGTASWAIDWPRVSSPDVYDGRAGVNRQLQLPASIDARSDAEAVAAWLAARSNSPATSLAYRREVDRFMLWCLNERSKALSDVRVEDCRAYMAFLGDVPAAWISRAKVAPFTKGWHRLRGSFRRQVRSGPWWCSRRCSDGWRQQTICAATPGRSSTARWPMTGRVRAGGRRPPRRSRRRRGGR